MKKLLVFILLFLTITIPDYISIDGNKNLLQAANSSRIEIIKKVLNEGADINTRDKNGRTFLMYAAQLKNYKFLKFLLDAGAKVNLSDNYGSTALHEGCCRLHTLKILLKYGADVNAKNNDGMTILMYVARDRHYKLLKFLLNARAKVNLRNSLGETALHIACKRGDFQTIKLLVKYGADVNAIKKMPDDSEKNLNYTDKIFNLFYPNGSTPLSLVYDWPRAYTFLKKHGAKKFLGICIGNGVNLRIRRGSRHKIVTHLKAGEKVIIYKIAKNQKNEEALLKHSTIIYKDSKKIHINTGKALIIKNNAKGRCLVETKIKNKKVQFMINRNLIEKIQGNVYLETLNGKKGWAVLKYIKYPVREKIKFNPYPSNNYLRHTLNFNVKTDYGIKKIQLKKGTKVQITGFYKKAGKISKVSIETPQGSFKISTANLSYFFRSKKSQDQKLIKHFFHVKALIKKLDRKLDSAAQQTKTEDDETEDDRNPFNYYEYKLLKGKNIYRDLLNVGDCGSGYFSIWDSGHALDSTPMQRKLYLYGNFHYYNGLRPGMTQKQVIAILGTPAYNLPELLCYYLPFVNIITIYFKNNRLFAIRVLPHEEPCI